MNETPEQVETSDPIEAMQLRCIVCTNPVPAKRATSRSKNTCSPECYKRLKQFHALQLQRVKCPACYHPSTPEERKDFREWRKHRGDVREGRGRPPVMREKKLLTALDSTLTMMRAASQAVHEKGESQADYPQVVAAMDAEIAKLEKLLGQKRAPSA